MIATNSRYANSPVILVDTPSAFISENRPCVQCIYFSSQEAFTFGYVYHLWKDTDRPDSLAHTFYGDATMWWYIADANPEILSWDNIQAGTLIRIPNS